MVPIPGFAHSELGFLTSGTSNCGPDTKENANKITPSKKASLRESSLLVCLTFNLGAARVRLGTKALCFSHLKPFPIPGLAHSEWGFPTPGTTNYVPDTRFSPF